MRVQVNGLFDAVDEYISASEGELKADKTLEKYRSILKIFKEFTGNIPLDELSDSTLREFIANEAGRRRIINGEEIPYSSETIYTRYKVIKGFVRWLHSHRYIAEDITQYTKNPRRDYHLPEVLSETQVKNIFRKLRASDNYRNYVIFETFLYTGIRLNELTQLKVEDLNFETGRMKVWGKGHRDETVPMGPQLMRDLKNYILNFRRPAIPTEKALFINQDGFKLERHGVQIMVKRVLERAGVTTKVGPHILRHTFATQYLRQGGSMEALRKILRHSNINVTARYTHLLMEDVDDDYHRIGIERFGRH